MPAAHVGEHRLHSMRIGVNTSHRFRKIQAMSEGLHLQGSRTGKMFLYGF